MNRFVTLLVDDERGQYTSVEDLADEIEGLELHYAPGQNEALDLIDRHFFHLAIVDVSLRREANPDVDGILILEILRDVRPSCERLLLTTLDREHRPQVLKALAPKVGTREPIAHGYVDKAEPELRASQIIRDRATRWLDRPVEIRGLEQILSHLAARQVWGEHKVSHAHGQLRPTIDEIDTILSRLFGQGQGLSNVAIETVDTVQLEPISEGWSRSATLWCEPLTQGRLGPRCVVKVGPRADSVEEVERYRSYVRYGLGLNHRVELLSASIGDTVGAACYTHSAARGEPQRDLQHLFNVEDSAGLEAVQRLFDPNSKFWIATQSLSRDLAKFFEIEYGRKVYALIERLTAYVEREATMTLNRAGSSLQWDGVELAVPCREDIGLGAFSGTYASCIVHGDLHGGNVLVARSGQPVLIDYRNMTRGPRCLDFVSLEVSVRMARGAVEELINGSPGAVVAHERAAWSADWGTGTEEVGPEAYWKAASSLLRRLAHSNFPDVTEKEYATCALLRTLRVLAAFAPQDAHRRRLLPYIGLLTEVIRESR